jgi:hypothetical protein
MVDISVGWVGAPTKITGGEVPTKMHHMENLNLKPARVGAQLD